MNNKQLITIAIAIFLFSVSCKKGSIFSKKSNHFAYTVNPLSDVSVLRYADSTMSIPLNITASGDNKEMITIFPDAATHGITTSFTVLQTNVFPFSTDMKLRVRMSTPGTYPVTIKTKSPSTDTQLHKFNVIITENGHCASALAGTYTITDPINGGVVKIVASGDSLLIPDNGTSAMLAINCNEGTLSVKSVKYPYYYWIYSSETTPFSADSILVDYVETTTPSHGITPLLHTKRTFKRL